MEQQQFSKIEKVVGWIMLPIVLFTVAIMIFVTIVIGW
jgi:cell division protein FtsL